MSKGNEPAFPAKEFYLGDEAVGPQPYFGLTKREYFAAMAMQGMLSIPPRMLTEDYSAQQICAAAVRWADTLLEELERK